MHQRRLACSHWLRVMRLSLVVAAFATAALYGASAQAESMSMGPPENVAAAYAALKAGHLSAARADLNKAIATPAEPAMARGHAQEALAALTQHKLATARMHAQNGAAVEHFTYALSALNQGTKSAHAIARGHLEEASGLPMYRRYADAALAALAARKFASAKAKTRQGLHAAQTAP